MPGTQVVIVEQVNPSGIPTDTGVAFFVGQSALPASAAPPTSAQKITSLTTFENLYGPRAGVTTALWDAVDIFFREGGAVCYCAAAGGSQALNYSSALDQFTKELGPGQVAAPGGPDIGAALLQHAADNHRIALLDAPDDDDPDVLAAAAAVFADDPNNRYGAIFGPTLICSGPAPGTTRTIPASAVVAGLIARSDRSHNANEAAAGNNGQSRTAVELGQVYSSAQADTLNESSVNMFRSVYGVIELYGYRSLAPKDDDPEWWQLTASRLYMAIAANCEPALQRALFSQLDGTRTRLAQLEGEVGSVLLTFFNQGALYGADPTQAFRVDATSLAVNPDDQLAQGLVRVAVEVRMSPFGEVVRLELMKTSITTPLSV